METLRSAMTPERCPADIVLLAQICFIANDFDVDMMSMKTKPKTKKS